MTAYAACLDLLLAALFVVVYLFGLFVDLVGLRIVACCCSVNWLLLLTSGFGVLVWFLSLVS